MYGAAVCARRSSAAHKTKQETTKHLALLASLGKLGLSEHIVEPVVDLRRAAGVAHRHRNQRQPQARTARALLRRNGTKALGSRWAVHGGGTSKAVEKQFDLFEMCNSVTVKLPV